VPVEREGSRSDEDETATFTAILPEFCKRLSATYPEPEKQTHPRGGGAKQQVKLVAGIEFEPMTFRL
jgi:hypothetical protein